MSFVAHKNNVLATNFKIYIENSDLDIFPVDEYY